MNTLQGINPTRYYFDIPTTAPPQGSVDRGDLTETLPTGNTVTDVQTVRALDPQPGVAGDPAMSTYTAQALKIAQASEAAADKLQEPFGDTQPAQDDVDWTVYATSRRVAEQDWARAEQAIAAELRAIYGGDPGNQRAVENAAREIADRYRDDPDVQQHIVRATNTVLSETPLQRETNQRLYDVDVAATKLDDLTLQHADGLGITPQEIAAARQDYETKQALLLAAVRKELDDRYSHLSNHVWFSEDDPLGFAARSIDRYSDDPELSVVLQAAVALKRVNTNSLGVDAQMNTLGTVLPPGVDPSVKRLVLADSQVAALIDTFITQSAGKVADAYRDFGTVAAANMLRDVTNPNSNAGLSPQIAAQIILKAMPTTTQVMNDVAGGQIKVKDGRAGMFNYSIGVEVATAWSMAVDSAARGSDPVARQWDSPQIQQAVEGMGRLVATHPVMDVTVFGFKNAVGQGYATLALESLRQIKALRKEDFDGDRRMSGVYSEDQKKIWLEATAGAIDDGLHDLQENAHRTLSDVTGDMAPLLAQGRYAPAVTDEQFRKGMAAIANSDEDLRTKVQQGQARIDEFGLRLVRTSEAVSFYEPQLQDVVGFDDVQATRNQLMSDEAATNIIMLSGSATFRMATQVARNMLAQDLQNGGRQAQSYGIGAQVVGDFAEFLAERYVIKARNAMVLAPDGTRLPAAKTVNIAGEVVEVTRVGHLPFPSPQVIWGVGGGLQAALTIYLFNTVHIDGPAGDLRKGLLLGLVGGFAGFHLYQAAMATLRYTPTYFMTHEKVQQILRRLESIPAWIKSQITGAAQADPSWGRFVQEGSVRDRWTVHTVAATPGLIKSLVVLMGIAVAWDASGVVFNATGVDASGRVPFKIATQSVNLVNDLILLRLQVREWAKKQVGAEAMSQVERITAEYMLAGMGKNEARRLAAKAVAQTLGEQILIRVGGSAILDLLGPIGWIVNIGYLATTAANLAFDHNKNINAYEKFDRTFLSAAGMDAPLADVMDEHEWWGSEAKADGLIMTYVQLGGDPTQFFSWLNKLSPDRLGKLIDNLEPFGRTDIEQLPPTSSGDYWTLPADPDDARQRSLNPNLVYNQGANRWEDTQLHMWYEGDGVWVLQDPTHVNQWKSFDARTHVLTESPWTMPDGRPMQDWANGEVVSFTSVAGLRMWMLTNNYELPPTPA